MIEFVIIGIVAIILLYIIILYCANSKKIKQKKASTEKKPETSEKKSANTTSKVVEVNSQVIKGTMFEEAVKEAEKAGFDYKAMSEPETAKKPDNSRLKLDREEFVSELKKSNIQKLKVQKLIPDRKEGPAKTSNTKSTEKKQQSASISDQLNGLSPELKALFINDILNKKY